MSETIFALLGVVIGGLLAIGGSLLGEKRRQQHADRTRFQDRRLQAYVELLLVAEKLLTGREREDYDSLRSSVATVALISTEEVREAAERFLNTTIRLRSATDDESADTFGLAQAEARRKLEEAIRAELTIEKKNNG